MRSIAFHGTVKVQAVVIGLLAALLATDAPALADQLKLGNEGVDPTFSIVGADGKPTGIEPDWPREMCKRMNAALESMMKDCTFTKILH